MWHERTTLSQEEQNSHGCLNRIPRKILTTRNLPGDMIYRNVTQQTGLESTVSLKLPVHFEQFYVLSVHEMCSEESVWGGPHFIWIQEQLTYGPEGFHFHKFITRVSTVTHFHEFSDKPFHFAPCLSPSLNWHPSYLNTWHIYSPILLS